MLRIWIILATLSLSAPLSAGNEDLFDELDAAISQRATFIAEKEKKIGDLKQKANAEKDSIAFLKIINQLYDEYHVFQFDSAMTYADRGLQMAIRQKDEYYITLFTIHRAEILAIGGLYMEAVNCLDSLALQDMGRPLRFEYYMTTANVYSYWSSYSQNTPYSSLYWQRSLENRRLSMDYFDNDNPLYDYYQGENCTYILNDPQKARQHYIKTTVIADSASRVYAMASYALAGNYMAYDQDQERYEKYLIHAAMADLRSCTMETVAMQMLAIHLFEKGKEQMQRAERYINISMEDAKFYNNRLRILEISRILPQIMNTYQDITEQQNRHLRYSIGFISLLVVALLFTAYFIYRQNRKLNARRHELAESNQQLTTLNAQLAESNGQQAQLNSQLHELNERLVYTNKHRERLASIYIDLCAKYIDKLGKYQTLVKRKIKAHQEQELLQTISSTRISEEDAATFLNRFDKAFLELYPTFVEEFNALLTEEGRIAQKSPTTLTTELRTFALIRLGVKNTADIAGLLFLSNQTIYNCRSIIKNKAINKDSFDDDVMRLCRVIR